MKKSKFFLFLIIILAVFLTTRITYSTDDFLASRVKDISDRNYEDAGCVIHFMPSRRTLHDKLIVVDSRYVVEGSANWSISALRNNFESSTLIDSPDLARAKIARLDNLPLDLYLLLLAHSQAINQREFFVNLETMALSLGMPRSWDDTALRRQVIKSLKKLQNRYHLLKVTFFYGQDAAISLIDIPGESFSISSDQIIQPQDKKLTMRLKFLFLLEALLKDEGVDIYSISQSALAKRFNVDRATIRAAFQDLQNYKK